MLTSALGQFINSLNRRVDEKTETPSEWIGRYFFVPDPRDPITGEVYPPGPIILADHQKRLIDEALSKDDKGHLKYSTVIYSAPKKSGKSAISSAVGLYVGMHNAFANIYCLANDGEQSSDRLYQPIKTCFLLHDQLEGPLKGIKYSLDEVVLPNHTKIEAVPCDAAGQAGSQPLLSMWSEIWGFETERKQRLWTETTIPPTLYGRAMRWVETYAGEVGKASLLENLYDVGVRQGTPHPDFTDLTSELSDNGNAVVFVNETAKMFVYWDHEPRMIWQSPEFYAVESTLHPVNEFNRVHKNLWVSPVDSFIQESWWDVCENSDLPILSAGDRTPVIVAVDMAETQDCAALLAITRCPFSPDDSIAVRAVRIFDPKIVGRIDQERLIRPVIEDWKQRWNVVCWVYDPYQMAKLAQDMVREGMGWFKSFGQHQPRAVADKSLYDMIVHKQVTWNRHTTEGDVGQKGTSNDNTLYKHITKAGATTTSGRFRIEKLSSNTHIDACVALSMAAKQAMSLAISNQEGNPQSLVRMLQNRQITLQEFSERVRVLKPELKDAIK